MAGLINDGRHDAGQWQRATAGHQGRGAWQRGHHVATGFGLPEGVHDRALLVADVFVVPHPGFGVDGLTHRAEDAQAAQVRRIRMHFGISFSCFDQ